MNVIRSVSDNQDEILKWILELHCDGKFDCDITYGNGRFYKNINEPLLKFDIDPQTNGVVKASSTELPVDSNSIDSIVFDPPFLTYVKSGRYGNGSMVMANRFGGYWKYDELKEHYINTLKECSRVLKKKGKIVFKCQDIIHNHRIHCTHFNVIQWAEELHFRLRDMFILTAKHRMPCNKSGKQQHARIFHSYFLVFEK
jgi:tRNA G10  N-methylase Trm11